MRQKVQIELSPMTINASDGFSAHCNSHVTITRIYKHGLTPSVRIDMVTIWRLKCRFHQFYYRPPPDRSFGSI